MKLPHLLLAPLLAVAGFAAEPLTVTADRADALYRQGETVTFTIRLADAPADAAVSWTISKDGVAPVTNGKLTLTDGRATVSGKLDEPGFLTCRVGFVTADRKPLKAAAGAAIDPRKIAPSQPAPDDFDAFWAAEKEKLARVPMNARLTPQPQGVASVDAFDVQADAIGSPVSAYFARPKGAKAKSLPALLNVHGAGVGSSGLAVATQWAAEGFLAMDMNAHGLPNGRPKEFYSELSRGALKGYPVSGRESRDTIYFREMFLRLIRAIDFLAAQPEWDGRTVVVRGSSQGGFQAIAAAGLDPRVTFFAAGVPAGCDHTGFKVGRVNGWPKFARSDETNPPANVVAAARYFDSVNFAARTRAPGAMTVGFIDATCPPTTVYAARNVVRAGCEIFHDIPTGHANSPKALAFMRSAILAHIAARKPQ